MSTTTLHRDALQQPEHPRTAPTGRIGLIVVASAVTGIVAAVALVIAPFVDPQQNDLSGLVLLGFAVGWLALAVLSVRFSDQPQRWAVVPAVFMAVAGGITLSGPTGLVPAVFGWVWPPLLLVLVVWMVIRARRHLDSRTRRWLLYPVFATLILASVGGGYETAREAIDATTYPAPGQLVDVGGHRLHLHCTGTGSPTVVLEPGLGATSSDVAWIAPVVAKDSRVCVYDRAGRGWSDAADGPQDGKQIAADLHTLLDRAHIPGPYVLAGHSFGGLYVLSFAAQFPDQVAGLVLIDSTAPKPGSAPATDSGSGSGFGRLTRVVPAIAHLGAGRLLAQSSFGNLPPRARDEARANTSTARYLGSWIEEFLEGDASTRQAASVTDLNGKPLVVLTAGRGNDAAWKSAQDKLAALSTNSRHRIVAGATHDSLLDES